MSARGLGAAHRGYLYQDAATSLILARKLAAPFKKALIDKKLFIGDVFDDLSLETERAPFRCQFKSGSAKPFEGTDLSTKSLNARVDTLVQALKRSPPEFKDFRLCLTRVAPADRETQRLLRNSSLAPLFPGSGSRVFMLDGEVIWPTTGQPAWRVFQNQRRVSRAEFLSFCAKFSLELGCPQASCDLDKPGPIETALFQCLSDDVGIGAYPNQDLNPTDSAARLISLIASARANATSIEPRRVLDELRIKTDYGRISQSFPVNQGQLVRDDILTGTLVNAVNQNRVTVVVGPPGSGKSWVLTELARRIEKDGILIARHYCYLEPGDEQVQLRIMTERAFSNLIAELADQFPAGAHQNRPLYAAGPAQLERMATSAVENGKQVVFMVDGLDHIARVLAEARGVAPGETDIIDEIASLKLPDGVSIIIGSQPGPHLDPLLRLGVRIDLPPWNEQKISALATKLGLPPLLPGDKKERTGLLKQLAVTADGNPLYSTFLCKALIQGLSSGRVVDPVEILDQLPTGDIDAYYSFLRKALTPQAGVVVDLLGVIDFGVTIDELRTIFPLPPIALLIQQTIDLLRPILTNVTAQGGIRIYHESFRRHIVEDLKKRGASLPDTLEPLIRWLEGRGFHEDPKAFRFLLPCLRRAQRTREILDRVGFDFVSRSVEFGHPRAAIWANLQVAINVAADETDWKALARLTELHRAQATCFEDKLQDFGTYGRTYASVFGASALRGRLEFDGRPTYNSANGLLLCSVSDDLGERPPWELYLNLNDGSEKSDDVELALARFHGIVRTSTSKEIHARVSSWLKKYQNSNDRYLRGVLDRLGASYGSDFLKSLDLTQIRSNDARVKLEIALATQFRREGQHRDAARVLKATLSKVQNPSDACDCLRLGADPKWVPTLDLMVDSELVTSDSAQYEEQGVELWLGRIGVLAYTASKALTRHKRAIKKGNWYRGWLLFAIELAFAHSEKAKDPSAAERRMVKGFSMLAEDTEPFKGTPRACDLYRLHPVIRKTISSGLNFITQRKSWVVVLRSLEKVAKKTTTFLQNSASGPLTRDSLCELLIDKMSPGESADLICSSIGRLADKASESGFYLEVLAAHEMEYAQALSKAGSTSEARRRWQMASVLLCGYGFRKDTTVFEVVECLPDLYRANPTWGVTAFARTQRLIEAVLSHTDGKETRHAPAYWFEALLESDRTAAMYLLARSLTRFGGRISFRLEKALKEVLKKPGGGNPIALNFLEASLLEGASEDDVARRFEILSRINANYPALIPSMARLVLAEVEGDTHDFRRKAFDSALAKIRSLGFDPGRCAYPFLETAKSASSSGAFSPQSTKSFAERQRFPVFPADCTPSTLMSIIRELRGFSDDSETLAQLTNALGFRLVQLAQQGQVGDAERLLRFFGREYYKYSESASILSDLGEGFERYGLRDLSALAFTLAFARSRGSGGWLALGGKKHQPWLKRASELSEQIAQRTLANEIARILESQKYVIGVTRHLAELSAPWLTRQQQIEIWEAAYQVINHRLPVSQDDEGTFVPFQVGLGQGWAEDDLLGLLLIARVSHPELQRKMAGLAGLALLVRVESRVVQRALHHALRQDTPVSTLTALLHLLWIEEQPPYAITIALKDELTTWCSVIDFSLRHLSSLLLKRAGLPGIITFPPAPPKPVFPSAKELAVTLSLDGGRRVESLGKLWDELPGRTAAKMDQYWASETNKDRAKNRHRAAWSSTQRGIPQTRMLFWENELFDLALEEVSGPLDAILFAKGRRTERFMLQVLKVLLPDLEQYVPHWNSRVVRPPLEKPSEQRAGTTPIGPLVDSAEFNGWFRVALWECEMVSDETTYPTVKEKVEVFGGIVLNYSGRGSDGDVPLGKGVREMWWPPAFSGKLSAVPSNSPLAGLMILGGRLGVHHVLGLPPVLSSQMTLRRSPASRLELVDSNGRVAVVYRQWRVRPLGTDIDEETMAIRGADLVISPETMERIQIIGGAQMAWVTQPFRTPVSRNSDDDC